ncbi:MAG: hypothetical protein K8S24_11830 [Candidatus Aegiribacteria sp.]|nr:hypothetical protein [Candidatus Aegiribacteria sp.]
MDIKCWMVCAAAALLMLCGCTDLTKFDHAMRSGINILHTPDLSVVHTIDNISGARSLCPLPGCFIVMTTEGMLFRFDLESYEQTGSFIIGNPSSSGYFEMEYSPTESSVYIIGAYGQIIELHVPDMEIMDSFTICETPVDIEIGTDIELSHFYVAGATSCKIFEVRLGTNSLFRSCTLPSSPTCMAISQNQDTIIVGTLDEVEIVSIVTTTMWRRTVDLFPTILAIETIPNDTTFSAVFSNGQTATILNYIVSLFAPTPLYTGTLNIEGNIHYICAESDGSHVYILSYLGDNISRVVAYNCRNYFIESQTDLKGYPLDLEISTGGTLLVLTAE